MGARGATPAITLLTRAGVEFEVHEYELTEEAETYGEAVALELGVDPVRLFKTLITEVDGEPTVAIVPSAGMLSLKSLAKAVGGKRASMADPAAAERWTGYVTGGISPFGQRKRMPVVVDESVRGHDTVFASAGRRGIQVEVRPADLVSILNATEAAIAEPS